jgi:hypothetical protein
MTRVEIINRVSKYFAIYELVDKQTYERFGERSWQFFDTDTLHCLLLIREGINKPIDVNNWFWDGLYDERGLRTNLCEIVKSKTNANKLYLSGHVMGKAIDFKISGMDSEDVRKWIIDNEDIFPCKLRLEHKKLSTGKPISWVHFDTYQLDSNAKIYLFNV